MLSFRQFTLTEAVEKSDIAVLRKEAGYFSKNIRRIKDGHDIYTVAQAYAKWRYILEKRIYDQLLGMKAWKDKEESYAASQLREKMWSLIIDTNPFMPRLFYRLQNDEQVFASYSGEGFPVLRYNDATKATWEEYYKLFDKQRNQIYTRYTRLVRDAFDALDDWLQDQPDTLVSHYDTSSLRHDGVTVQFVGTEMNKDDKLDDSEKRTYLRSLSVVLKRMRQLGLARFVDKLIYEYNRADHVTGHAGEYLPGKVVSYILEGNSPEVIAHEIFHHVFKVLLTDASRKAWTDFIEHHQVSFSEADYAEIRTAFFSVYHELLPSAGNGNYDYVVKNVWENVSKHLKNPVTKELYDAYAAQRNHVHMSVLKKDPEGEFQTFKNETSKPFNLHVPTTYSNKNPEEAFCETGSYFVVGKPIKGIIKHQFLLLTGLRDL